MAGIEGGVGWGGGGEGGGAGRSRKPSSAVVVPSRRKLACIAVKVEKAVPQGERLLRGRRKMSETVEPLAFLTIILVEVAVSGLPLADRGQKNEIVSIMAEGTAHMMSPSGIPLFCGPKSCHAPSPEPSAVASRIDVLDLVVSINRRTQILAPKYYNPYHHREPQKGTLNFGNPPCGPGCTGGAALRAACSSSCSTRRWAFL